MNHIVLICDNAYVLPTIVTIQSIKECIENQKEHFCIHICSPKLDEHHKEKIESMKMDLMDVCVHLFDFNDLKDKIANVQQKSHVSVAALVKFNLPFLFPNIDRILYLDSDIVVKNDFLNIFSVDVSDYYLAAVYEFWKYLYDLRYCPSNLKKKVFYFNSGVMLLNLKKMRIDHISEKLWDYKKNHAKTKLMDQECFNKICGSLVLPLTIEWNLNPFFLQQKFIGYINDVYNVSFQGIEEILESAKIIHYVGKSDKPWIYKNARYNEIWMKFYDKVFASEQLVLKEFESVHLGFFERFIGEIKEHGFWSFCCFLRYKILSRMHLI